MHHINEIITDRWPAFTASITFELFKRTQIDVPQTMLQTILSPFKTKPAEEHCTSAHTSFNCFDV